MNTKIPIRTLCIFFPISKSESMTQNTRKLWTKSITTQTKNRRKKIRFHSFQNVSQLFGPTNKNGSFWAGGRFCISLTRTGPIVLATRSSFRQNFSTSPDRKNWQQLPERLAPLGIVGTQSRTPFSLSVPYLLAVTAEHLFVRNIGPDTPARYSWPLVWFGCENCNGRAYSCPRDWCCSASWGKIKDPQKFPRTSQYCDIERCKMRGVGLSIEPPLGNFFRLSLVASFFLSQLKCYASHKGHTAIKCSSYIFGGYCHGCYFRGAFYVTNALYALQKLSMTWQTLELNSAVGVENILISKLLLNYNFLGPRSISNVTNLISFELFRKFS